MSEKLKIEYVSPDKIKPYANNPRRHSREQIEAIRQSVERLGNRKPIEIDENGVIICGHGRFEAYQSIGMREIPVIIHSDMTESEKKAYRIADNELALRSEWDIDSLNIELENLKLDGFDLKVEIPEINYNQYSEIKNTSKEIDANTLINNGIECPKCHFIFEAKNE